MNDEGKFVREGQLAVPIDSQGVEDWKALVDSARITTLEIEGEGVDDFFIWLTMKVNAVLDLLVDDEEDEIIPLDKLDTAKALAIAHKSEIDESSDEVRIVAEFIAAIDMAILAGTFVELSFWNRIEQD